MFAGAMPRGRQGAFEAPYSFQHAPGLNSLPKLDYTLCASAFA